MPVLLLWTLILPLIGAAIVLLATPRDKPGTAGPIAFLASLVPLALVVYMTRAFNYASPEVWQFSRAWQWIPLFGIQFSIGMDTISLWLVVLTAVLTPISILASFNYIKQRQPEFYAWMLILHAGMLGVFCARDVLVFYLFFEFSLVPMFFIIGIWGGQERRHAAGKFFLFTFAGSVLTLASLLYLAYLQYAGYHGYGADVAGSGNFTFDFTALASFGAKLPLQVQWWLFFGLLAGFAVKVPLFPVHTWLPLAHTEAPTAGSVILAGVLLKLGTYGLLRFAVGMLPAATASWAPIIATICVIGILYGALVSWVQQDMKKLIAYSSVSHLGFCVLGMFALTAEGLTGSVLYMINHGLSTGALFLVVGMVYERYHTRDMNQMSGLVRRLPALGFFAVFFVFSSVALPGLNGFVSEFLVLLGTFVSGRVPQGSSYAQGNLGPAWAVPAALGVILGAVYLLYWAGKIIYGPLKEPAAHHETDEENAGHHTVRDLTFREWAVLSPIAALVVVLGVYPNFVVGSLQRPVQQIAANVKISPETHRYVAERPATPAAPARVEEAEAKRDAKPVAALNR